jgi:hypothetical protein
MWAATKNTSVFLPASYGERVNLETMAVHMGKLWYGAYHEIIG